MVDRQSSMVNRRDFLKSGASVAAVPFLVNSALADDYSAQSGQDTLEWLAKNWRVETFNKIGEADHKIGAYTSIAEICPGRSYRVVTRTEEWPQDPAGANNRSSLVSDVWLNGQKPGYEIMLSVDPTKTEFLNKDHSPRKLEDYLKINLDAVVDKYVTNIQGEFGNRFKESRKFVIPNARDLGLNLEGMMDSNPPINPTTLHEIIIPSLVTDRGDRSVVTARRVAKEGFMEVYELVQYDENRNPVQVANFYVGVNEKGEMDPGKGILVRDAQRSPNEAGKIYLARRVPEINELAIEGKKKNARIINRIDDQYIAQLTASKGLDDRTYGVSRDYGNNFGDVPVTLDQVRINNIRPLNWYNNVVVPK